MDTAPASGEMITPAMELELESEDGAVSGVQDGGLVTGIEGMDAADIRPYSAVPWALTPAEDPILYSVETDHVDAFLSEGKSEAPRENESAELELEHTSYKQEDGETESVSHESSVEIDPESESLQIGASGNLTVQPMTANKPGTGEWVEAELEIPFEDIDIESVNVSSFRLNGEVHAVDDDQYGFVRNPVEDEQIQLKFPRAEVLDQLDVGEAVTVTVSGTTESGQVLIGDDEIRVIDEGALKPRNGPPFKCEDWRGQVEYNDNVLDVLTCPPGLDGEWPTPSHLGEPDHDAGAGVNKSTDSPDVPPGVDRGVQPNQSKTDQMLPGQERTHSEGEKNGDSPGADMNGSPEQHPSEGEGLGDPPMADNQDTSDRDDPPVETKRMNPQNSSS